jgi:hypothetical protein
VYVDNDYCKSGCAHPFRDELRDLHLWWGRYERAAHRPGARAPGVAQDAPGVARRAQWRTVAVPSPSSELPQPLGVPRLGVCARQ